MPAAAPITSTPTPTGISMFLAMMTMAVTNTADLLPPLIDDDDDDFDHARFCCFSEPLTPTEARRADDWPKWKAAMKEEIDGFWANQSWDLVQIDPSWNLIKSKWVYKLKKDKDGNIDRYRARLVAKGFMQRPGQDFGEVFAPVIRYSTLRIILALCAHYGLYKRHMDAPKAFTQAKLDTPCYMKAPPGVTIAKGMCFILYKSIYGLKQASNRWYNYLKTFLLSLGFIECFCDICLFFLVCDVDSYLIIGIYVDDILCCGTRNEDIDRIYDELHKKFSVVDLGDFEWSLGMRIHTSPDRHTIQLDFSAYVQKIIDRFEFNDLSPVPVPMQHTVKLTSDDCPTTDDEKLKMAAYPFRSAISCLQWLLLLGRLDISFAVVSCSRFSSNPGMSHWLAVVMIFRYLIGAKDIRITYTRLPNCRKPIMVAYTDADWGTADVDKRRTVTGFIIMMCGGPIIWRTKFTRVCLSTYEVEGFGCGDVAKEVVGARHVMTEIRPIKFDASQPTTIFGDNDATIKATRNPKANSSSIHTQRYFHFIRVLTEEMVVRYQKIPRDHNWGDFMVKPLIKAIYRHMRHHLMGPFTPPAIVFTTAESMDRKRKFDA
jgi:hypothetical protein